MHIDTHYRGGEPILQHVLSAALTYYCDRISQPRWSILISNGGLTEYELPRDQDISTWLSETYLDGIMKRNPEISGDTPPERLESALEKAGRGTMIVTENPETYVDDMESLIRTLFEQANRGLYMLVVTGDPALAEGVVAMRQESGSLDAEYTVVYGFEPEDGGHAIIEY